MKATSIHKNTVLISYPRTFGIKNLFASKVTHILSSLEEYEIISVDDYRGFIDSGFKEKILKKIDSRQLHSRDIRKLISESTYVILFWDGVELVDYVYYTLLLRKVHRIIPIETTKVVNKDKGAKYDVYIGRGTPWGNPFAIGDEGNDREAVILKFREYFEKNILSNTERRRDLLSLRGKRLGCHCKPLACHGDIIAEYLNTLDDEGEDFHNTVHQPASFIE